MKHKNSNIVLKLIALNLLIVFLIVLIVPVFSPLWPALLLVITIFKLKNQ